MDQATSGLRLPVLAAVDRTASYAAMPAGGVASSQDWQQILGGIMQALPLVLGALL